MNGLTTRLFAIFEVPDGNMRKLFRFSLILLMACSSTSRDGEEQSRLEQSNQPTDSPEVPEKTIMFFGNSITAGYQLDIDNAFPALIQDHLDSLGYSYQVINAGLSGETSASGVSRIDWVLRTVPDIFMLELGGNDGLRGLPLSETLKNLQLIIDAVQEKNPDVKLIIAGMEVPPNLGQDYTAEFRNLFPTLAENNNAVLIPFLLEGVAGNPDLNLSDGIHPTEMGHSLVAKTVWVHLEPLLDKEDLNASS